MGYPFGYDPIEADKIVNAEKEINKKIYVDVTVDWRKDGTILPISFILNDKEHKISKVLSMQKGCSLKIYAPGFRYRCQVGKRYFFLHYDGERWYFESKNL